jgi:uncharacterized protein
MRQRILVLLPVLLLVACGGSPKTRFHTLVPMPAGQGTHVAAKAGKPIQVGNVALPSTLDRLSLVTRGRGTTLDVSDQDRWAAPLDELVRRALTSDLRDRLGTSLVLAPGDPQPPEGVRSLALNVQQFSSDSTGQVVLNADWTVGDRNSGKTVQSHHVALRVKSGSASPDAITAGMSQAVAQLADAIAGELSGVSR